MLGFASQRVFQGASDGRGAGVGDVSVLQKAGKSGKQCLVSSMSTRVSAFKRGWSAFHVI